MGSLSNLYISQSYISLIHLGSDNTASTNPVELQDGLGNGIGIYVNTNGAVSASGFSGSINGIGNVTLFSASVDSRLNAGANIGFVTTASFNAYTQSTNAFTASISTSVGLLQTFSSSEYKGDSSSFDSRINSISSSTLTDSASFNSRILANSSSIVSVSQSLNTFSSSYKNDSSSFDSRILSNSSSINSVSQSLVSVSQSLNTFSSSYYLDSSSFDSRILNNSSSISSVSQSLNLFSSSYKTDSSSFDSRIDNLEIFSQSADSRYVRNSQTSSMAVSSSTYAITASYALNAQTASEARNLIVIARNGNQSTLSAGTVVHITGASGDNPIFNTASYDTELLSANTLGILRSTLTSGADGEVVVNGIVTGVNTNPANGYAAGDIVYLSSSGQFTKVQPQAPNQIVVLGQVLRANQNQGSLYVSINNGWELNELHNVQINNPQNGDSLVYQSGSYGLWKNVSTSSFAVSSSQYAVTASFALNVQSINTGSLVTTASFNTFTASYYVDSSSFNSRINNITASTQIESNGTILGSVTTLNFVGTGANVSVGASTASITINAGSGSGGGTAGNSYTSTFNGSTWVVNHNLNTSVPLVFAYESGSQWVIPASLDVTSANTVTLGFSSVVSGSVVVVNGGDQTVVSSIVSASSATITHNLDTEWPIVQFYETASKAQQIPQSVVSDNSNQITVTFSEVVSGKVVIKK